MANKVWRIISEFIGPLCLIIALGFTYHYYLAAKQAEKTVSIITTYIDAEINIDSFNNYLVMRESIDSIIDRKASESVIRKVNTNVDSIITSHKKDLMKLNKDSVILANIK